MRIFRCLGVSLPRPASSARGGSPEKRVPPTPPAFLQDSSFVTVCVISSGVCWVIFSPVATPRRSIIHGADGYPGKVSTHTRAPLFFLCPPPVPSLTLHSSFTSSRIKEIEFEMSRTQKNKATEHHLGSLKAKLAKLRTQLQEGAAGGPSKPGEGFAVQRFGHG